MAKSKSNEKTPAAESPEQATSAAPPDAPASVDRDKPPTFTLSADNLHHFRALLQLERMLEPGEEKVATAKIARQFDHYRTELTFKCH